MILAGVKVGDRLWMLSPNFGARQCLVTKVGRKWVHTRGPSFSIATGYSADGSMDRAFTVAQWELRVLSNDLDMRSKGLADRLQKIGAACDGRIVPSDCTPERIRTVIDILDAATRGIDALKFNALETRS